MKPFAYLIMLSIITTGCGNDENSELDAGPATIVPYIFEGMGRVFKSNNNDFGPILLGGAIPKDKSPLDLTGGHALEKICIHKRYKSITGLTDIVNLNYCIEGDINLEYQGKGSYITNLFIDVLDDLKFDLGGTLTVKAEIIKVNNISTVENPIAQIEIMVTTYFDGLIADLRSTDRMIIYGNSPTIKIVKEGKLQ